MAALAFIIGTGAGAAQAASLSTDVTVNLSSSLRLVCYDEVNVDLTSENFISAVGRNGSRALPDLTRNARIRNGRLIANGSRRFWRRGRFRFRRNVNLDLHNVCAYSAFGGIGGARVRVERLERQLDAPGGSFIRVRRVRTRDTENAGPWRRRYQIPATDLGNGVVRGIDVRLRLNLRNAIEPGLYSSPTDGTFRITVIPNP